MKKIIKTTFALILLVVLYATVKTFFGDLDTEDKMYLWQDVSVFSINIIMAVIVYVIPVFYTIKFIASANARLKTHSS